MANFFNKNGELKMELPTMPSPPSYSKSKSSFGDKIYEHFAYGDRPNKLVMILEFMIYFVGFLGTIFTLQPAYRVWTATSVGGESLVSWISLAAFTPFWIMYGLINKKVSLVMTYLVWLVMTLIVILGIYVRG